MLDLQDIAIRQMRSHLGEDESGHPKDKDGPDSEKEEKLPFMKKSKKNKKKKSGLIY